MISLTKVKLSMTAVVDLTPIALTTEPFALEMKLFSTIIHSII